MDTTTSTAGTTATGDVPGGAPMTMIQALRSAMDVMLFYAVGELFQDAAIDRAKRNIQALLDVRPDTANVVRDGVPVETPAAEVKVGDIIRIRVGDGC